MTESSLRGYQGQRLLHVRSLQRSISQAEVAAGIAGGGEGFSRGLSRDDGQLTCGGSYGTRTLCLPVMVSSTYWAWLFPSTRIRWLGGAIWPGGGQQMLEST